MTCSQLQGVVSARHWISNLLHTYVDFAERKDVDGAVGLLASARVSFPGTGSIIRTMRRSSSQNCGNHLSHIAMTSSNLVVLAGSGPPSVESSRALHSVGVSNPIPRCTPLGEYTMVVDERDWSIIELAVTRTWTRS